MPSTPRQRAVKAPDDVPPRPFTGAVIENIVAGVIGTALLVYLVYALIRPERF
jgi:K+-transporting ATPase KdpF subunit